MSKTNKISSMAPTHQADSLELYNDLIKSSLEEELINDVSQNEKEKKNRNIAISGDYGVGKSSIIRSFFHKNSNYKPLYVSLGSYIAKENINSNNYSEKEIEISILQQIIYSVEPSKLPFSRISRIDKKIDDTRCYCVIISLLLTILIILGICIINISKVEDLFNREWGANIFFGFTMILFLLLWWLLYYLMTNFSLKCISITTKDTEAELKKESFNDISILNKFVDELINFFISTKYEIIVFEDIDRLNKPIQIFSKLKEINSIINNAVKKKTIRFIYVIRDVIFDNAEIRTKFFDIIIPILPYSSTNTAYEKLEQDCKNILNLNLERSEYRKIGAFIDNYRYIADIVNEFQIFWNNIKNIFKNSTNNKFVKELKKDILFLVSYKVLYPKRFDLLYQNKGLISYYLSPEFKQEITQREKEKQIKRINYELSKATEKYMEEKKQYLDNFYEYLEETIPNFTRSDSAFYDENDNSILLYENIYEDDNINKLNNQKVVLKSSFMDQILTEEEIFKDGKNVFFSDLLNMHSDIDKLDKAKKNLNHLNYKTIDSKNVILYLEELYESYHSSLYYYSLNNENNTIDEEENSTIDKKENNTVNKKDNSITGNNKENIPNKKEYKNPYSYLNQFEKILINNDCLNDYTKKIINKKHNLALSLEDDYVLERIIKGNILEFDTKLDNAQMVLDEIDSTYFAFDYMCIKDIYTAAIKKYVVNKKISPEGKMFFENVFNNLTDYKLQFFKYLEDEKNSIFRYAFDYLDKVWDYIYDNGLESIDENLILFYFLLTIKYADSKAPPQNVFFYEAIENYNGIIQYLENNFKEISSKLSNFKIRFSPIVKFNLLISNRINVIEKDKKTELIENPNMMKLIYENDMFSIDLNHIMSICVALNFNYRKDRILESLKSNGKDNKIYLYLINNLSRTLNYLKDNNLIQNSSEIFLVELINNKNLQNSN